MLKAARRLLSAAGVVVVTACLPLSAAGAQASGNWPTYLDDGARTGFNSAERVITPSTAPTLVQRWADRARGAVSAEPVQVNGVVYYGSWDGHERAAAAATGAQLWSASLGQTTDTSCAPPTVGVASTATVGTIMVHGTATRTVFVGGGDGNFYALNAASGAVIWKTALGAPPDYFLWSSPVLYKGSLYEGISSFGDCPLIRGGVVQLNAVTGAVQHTLYTVPRACTGASVWGSPTVDVATGDIYFGTGNGGSCGGPEPLAVAVVQASRSLKLLSSWQVPVSQQTGGDSDFGSTPTLFQASISGAVHQMVGLQNKDGIYYAFDRSAISGGPLWRKRMSPGPDKSPSAYDGHHLFVGSEQTTIGGVACAGSIRELRPATGNAVWADCLRSGPVYGAVTAVRGVAFLGAGNAVYAVDTSTGAILWSRQDTSADSNFWGAPAISNGQVYIGNQDGNLYAFGTATARIVLRPVRASGRPAAGYHVIAGGRPVDCSSPKTSPVTVSKNVDFCRPDAAYAVACWRAAAHRRVMCFIDARRRQLVRYRLQSRFAATTPRRRPVPLDIRLRTGVYCRLRVGGAGSGLKGHPNWYASYFCTHRRAIAARLSSKTSGVNTSRPLWRVHVTRTNRRGRLVVRRVARAWFVGTRR